MPAADGADDQRACSPCACGAVEGSDCTAWLTIFKDSACTDPLFGRSLDTVHSLCQDMLGDPLTSKTLTKIAYQSGICVPSGGQPSGGIALTNMATFCCLP